MGSRVAWLMTGFALAAAPAFAQSSNVTIYGQFNLSVEAVRGPQADGGNPRMFRLSSNSSRIGFRGSEAISDDLTALFQVESSVQLDTGGGTWAGRDSYVGLQGPWGSLQVGNLLAPYDEISQLFGSVPTFLTSVLSTSTLWSQGALTKDLGGFDARLPNSVRYDTPVYRGFSGSVQTSLTEGSGASRRTGHVLSAAGFYNDGPLELAVAYERNVAVRAPDLNDEALSVAGGWDFGPVRAGAVYERLRYASIDGSLTRDFWGLSLTVPLGPGTVYGFYGKAMDGRGSAPVGTRIGGLARGDDTGADQWTFSYSFPLSKRTFTYAGYTRVGNQANSSYNFYINRYTVPVGASVSAFVLGTAHFF